MNFLIIDTREQSPLIFKATENYEVISEKLDFGDYGFKINNELICVFERKSALDLFGTLTKGHLRFKDEILRAKQQNVLFFVAIEESYSNIINKKFEGSFRTKMKGFILAKIIHTFQLRYGVAFMFFNNREEMRDYIRNTFNSLLNLGNKKHL